MPPPLQPSPRVIAASGGRLGCDDPGMAECDIQTKVGCDEKMSLVFLASLGDLTHCLHQIV